MELWVHSILAQIIIEDLVKLDYIYYTLGTVKPAEREAISAFIFKHYLTSCTEIWETSLTR